MEFDINNIDINELIEIESSIAELNKYYHFYYKGFLLKIVISNMTIKTVEVWLGEVKDWKYKSIYTKTFKIGDINMNLIEKLNSIKCEKFPSYFGFQEKDKWVNQLFSKFISIDRQQKLKHLI